MHSVEHAGVSNDASEGWRCRSGCGVEEERNSSDVLVLPLVWDSGGGMPMLCLSDAFSSASTRTVSSMAMKLF